MPWFFRATYRTDPWKRSGVGVSGLSNAPGGAEHPNGVQFDNEQKKISLSDTRVQLGRNRL